jgi:hypothetical protein
MREGLREVPQVPPGPRVNLLGVQPPSVSSTRYRKTRSSSVSSSAIARTVARTRSSSGGRNPVSGVGCAPGAGRSAGPDEGWSLRDLTAVGPRLTEDIIPLG